MRPVYFLGILIVLSFYWILTLYASFLLNIAIAFLLLVATSGVHQRILLYTKNHHLVASTASTLLLGLLFFAPIAYLIVALTNYLAFFDITFIKEQVMHFSKWVEHDLPQNLDFLKPSLEQITDFSHISNYASKGLDLLTTLGTKSAVFLFDTFLILVFYFMFLIYGKQIGNFLLQVIPLNSGQTLGLFQSTSATMSVVFYSILITAIFEGALFAVIAYIYDYDAVLFGILYGFASLVPIVGGALLWVPLAMYELSHNNTQAAIVIAIYSITMISIVADTFIKPIIIKYVNKAFIKSEVATNEIIIFFAIIAGLSTFGFWGMILGPAITTFFLSLLNLYKKINTHVHHKNSTGA